MRQMIEGTREVGMKKEELEALLGRDGHVPDLGPIEVQLAAVATSPQLPDLAIGLCLIRMEEAGPPLRAMLVRAADGEALSEDERTLIFRGLYMLGGARDSQACQPLLRLLRRPHEELEDLLGDGITEGLAKIVVGVFDGDSDALFDLVTDRSIGEFVRDALLRAAAFLTWEGRIERDRMRRVLERFHAERLAEDYDCAWMGWLDAIGLLGLRDLAPLVHGASREDRFGDDLFDADIFENDLAEAERTPEDGARFKRTNVGYIEDVVGALEWTRRLEDPADEPAAGEPYWTSPPPPNLPVVNPWRHVGRNDPCPCGSGKKAKKCCLDR